MSQRSFDHLFELRAVEGSAIRQPEEMTPGLGGKTPPLMRPHNPKSHPSFPRRRPSVRQTAPPFRKRRNPENATASKSTTAQPNYWQQLPVFPGSLQLARKRPVAGVGG